MKASPTPTDESPDATRASTHANAGRQSSAARLTNAQASQTTTSLLSAQGYLYDDVAPVPVSVADGLIVAAAASGGVRPATYASCARE
eukprot:scaffold2254_cov393-Prasinococcus_capsulatus_cf.AAC.2